MAEELESESEEAAAWLGSTTEIGRLKEDEQEEALLCLPGMRRTLWEPPVPVAAVTTTMAILYGGSELVSCGIQISVTLPRSNRDSSARPSFYYRGDTRLALRFL